MTDLSEATSSIDAFFLRCGLISRDQLDCFDFVQELHPGETIKPSTCQGFCSMTVFVGDNVVVQFRPPTHRLDLRITKTARDMYGRLAPETSFLGTMPNSGLLVYSMQRIDGVSYKEFRLSKLVLSQSNLCQATFCKDFAAFLAHSWHSTCAERLPLGHIGKSIRSRLELLCKNLPTRFRASAQNLLQNLDQIERLPWVLTHGDIVPGNIMVNASTGSLTGFVDWAEAERLPFGTCVYGLEVFLGEITSTGFQYRADSEQLRCLFWDELSKLIPDLQQSSNLKVVKLARDLGVMLWYGIAFDNGAIDRVVEENRDIEEIHRLSAYLKINEFNSADPLSKL